MALPIINGNRTAEDIVREHYARLQREAEERERARQPLPAINPVPQAPINPTAPATPPIVTSPTDYLKLENIQCTDADGQVFEQYSELYVRKDIFRGQDGKQLNFTPYNAAVHCGNNNLFLPSFALSCNILDTLYHLAVRRETDGSYTILNQAAKHLLDQYKDHGAGYGYQAQNTVINFKTEEIIHYPEKEDFEQTVAVNVRSQRTPLRFSKSTLQDSLLEDALKDQASTHYVQQLTGLVHPSVLVDIGKYFGKPAKLWFSWSGQAGAANTDKRAAWLGCNDIGSFGLSASGDLNSNLAVRGVRF